MIERLAHDLRGAFPEMKGFSPRNLKYMCTFAEAWPDAEFVQAVLAQSPWYPQLALLDKLPGPEPRRWYLLADVEVVATYKLHNLNRTRLENIFHRLFGAAQLDLTIEDRFGNPVKPREWFLVPLHVIDEAVQRIRDGSITNVAYDPKTARIVG